MITTDTAASGAAPPFHVRALTRHFIDLGDGTHGGLRQRDDKERLFREAVALLDGNARRALAEIDEHLLRGTGRMSATGAHRDTSRGLAAAWELAWPEQERAGVRPVAWVAHYGSGFRHPHIRRGSVGDR
ncbi:MAG TPA: hypothetical protein VNV66_17990 [Pilimelia sp.]|nr:hypothetical protein [Pilimelia sp.]